MLRKENIIFEDSIYIVGGYDIERIKNKILELAERMIFELDLFSLEKIYIRRQLLLDDKLGMARGDKEICLSFGTAIKLALEDNHNDIRRRDALATLYHEGYHIYDFRQLMRKLILCCPDIQNEQSELSKGYRLWTEFFAVFSTFDICEQEHKYDSFENVFSKLAPNTDDSGTMQARLWDIGYMRNILLNAIV